MAAGWLLLAIVDILWLIYFTSEENSLTLHLFNMLGTGGLTGPGRNGYRSGRRGTASHTHQNGIGSGYGGAVEYSSPNPPMSGSTGLGDGYNVMKENPMATMENSIQNNSQRNLGTAPLGSPNSVQRNMVTPSTPPAQMPVPMPTQSPPEETTSPRTPLMETNNPTGADGEYRYRAKALYACQYKAKGYLVNAVLTASDRLCITG